MARVRRSPRAKADINEVLLHTRDEWGAEQKLRRRRSDGVVLCAGALHVQKATAASIDRVALTHDLFDGAGCTSVLKEDVGEA